MITGGEAVLLERGDELRQARTLLGQACAGRGSLLLVEGPAGIGKSALIRELREHAVADGCAVLSARGAELERDFSYGVVRQLLEPALAAVSAGERAALLSGAARLAEPAIGAFDVGVEPEPSAASPSRDPSFAVLHGLYWLTANIAERSPVLISVDDAHWADAASLRFLAYLAGRLQGLRAIVVVGLRRFEPGSPTELIAALAAEDTAHERRLAALSEAGTDALVRSRLSGPPAPGFSAACHRATGGNPQLIRELLAALAAEGIEPTPSGAEHVARFRADRIAGSVLARLGRVGRSAVAVAQAIAVLGREATLEQAAQLAGLEVDDAGAAVDALVALELLLPGEPIAFVHPIVRAAVYADLGAAERGAAHSRAARLLADRDAGLDSVAAQIVATPPGRDDWAVVQLRAAAAAALSSGAPDAAVAYLERLLAENPPAAERRDALVGLGRALFMLRDPRGSIRRLLEALELTDDPRQRAEIVDIVVAGMLVSRAAARAVDLLDEAIAALPESERELGLRLESDIDSGSFFSLSAKRRAERRRRRFRDPDDPRMLARAAMTAALYGGGAEEAGSLARRAVGGGRLLRDGGPDSPPVWTAGFALLYAHRLSEARALADEWIREASRYGSLRAYSLASSLRTRAAYWSGDLVEAEADARAFMEGMPEAVGLGPSFLADTLIDQGKLDEAQDALALGGRADVEVEWSFFYASLLLTRGILAIRRGSLERGCEHLLEAGRVMDEWGVCTPGPLQWRPPAAEALFALGERDQARQLIEAELRQCRRYGSGRSLGIALRAAGQLDGTGRALELLDEAVRLLSASEARLEHARALVELGCALRRARRLADARPPLRDGLAAARACGALPLAERAHTELTATGARPRKIVRAGVEALTSSELRVARMAADGMANKDIAQALFVTVRTVEAHLHHAYQKLGIASRDQLERMLSEVPRAPAGV
ncbi:MAG TPA: AAA family ATPase [Solirubrobacteraceae bacterium]|nr:AAA family ATPase [Solirubrobacteraceae bacterium]